MNTDIITSPWIVNLKRTNNAQVRLWCFPYAGAIAQAYRPWATCLPEEVELCAIQLPGRGSRWMEPAFVRIPHLIELLAEAMEPFLDRPFVFFGHSLGAMIGFELSRYFQTSGIVPMYLFVSGCRAPQFFSNGRNIHKLAGQAFIDELRRFGGTPEEVLSDPSLMRIALPSLRSDFELFETHRYIVRPPLNCPITAFGGTDDDEVPAAKLEAWSDHTRGRFACHLLSGGHFFLQNRQNELVSVIQQAMNDVLNEVANCAGYRTNG